MRIINADRVCFELERFYNGYTGELRKVASEALDIVCMMPEIEAEPVKHGRWVNPYINFYGHPCHCCSECGFKASYQDKNYCPECGAKMDLEATDEA